jgi:hypothetical protein
LIVVRLVAEVFAGKNHATPLFSVFQGF